MGEKRRQYSASEKKKRVLEVDSMRREPGHVRSACELLGISPKQYYEWKRLLEAGGEAALEPKSRRPTRYGNQLDDASRQKVVSEAKSGNHKSANQIKVYLESCGIRISVPTIIGILEKADLYGFIEVRNGDGKLIKRRRGLISVKD